MTKGTVGSNFGKTVDDMKIITARFVSNLFQK